MSHQENLHHKAHHRRRKTSRLLLPQVLPIRPECYLDAYKDVDASKSQEASTASLSQGSRSPATKGRGPTRRYGPQKTRLEVVDDSLGPLGASTEAIPKSSDEPPIPPQKEQTSVRSTRPPAGTSQSSSLKGMMESVNLEDETESAASGRVPPPVQLPSPEGAKRQTQPSVSVEQAAKPKFNITVGDPHKVGGAASSHTEYAVRTKVDCSSSSETLWKLTIWQPGRPRPKRTGHQSSPCLGVIEISCGYTPSYTRTILDSSFHLLRRSKQLGDLTPILSSRAGRHWSAC